MSQRLRLVLVGTLAGFTSGLFGVGGGIVIVPALVMLAAFDQKPAVGTSLTAIIPISISGIGGYALDDEVDFVAAALVAAGAIAGALIGTRWLRQIGTPLLQVLFATVMVLAAVKLLIDDTDAAGRGDMTVAMAAGLVVLGLASGVLAGLFGVGGGIIIVPALTMFFGVPHVLAKGTSLAVILPTAVSGTLRNHRAGFADLRAAAVVGIAGIVTAAGAARVSLGLDPDVATALFAALVLVAAVRLGRIGIRAYRLQPGT